MRISKWGIPGVMVPLSRYHLIPFDVILTGPHHHYTLRSLSVYWEERLSKTVESRCQGSEVPTLSLIAQSRHGNSESRSTSPRPYISWSFPAPHPGSVLT